MDENQGRFGGPLFFHHAAEHGADFADARRFAENAVDIFRRAGLVFDERAPAREHDDRGLGGFAFDAGGHFTAVDVRHAEVRNDGIEFFGPVTRRLEGLDPGFTAFGRSHDMAVAFEHFADEFAHGKFVINAQDPERTRRIVIDDEGADGIEFVDGEDEADGGAAADGAVDFNLAFVAFNDAVDHGEAEAGATFALGGEEGFQAAPTGFIVHAHAGVFDLEDDMFGIALAE